MNQEIRHCLNLNLGSDGFRFNQQTLIFKYTKKI